MAEHRCQYTPPLPGSPPGSAWLCLQCPIEVVGLDTELAKSVTESLLAGLMIGMPLIEDPRLGGQAIKTTAEFGETAFRVVAAFDVTGDPDYTPPASPYRAHDHRRPERKSKPGRKPTMDGGDWRHRRGGR